MSLHKIRKGLESEFIASAWLTKNNYTIYWKTQDNDPIDLVAVHRNTGRTLKIDVKSVSIRASGRRKGDTINRVPSDAQKKIGVKLLYVYKDGRCDWNGKN